MQARDFAPSKSLPRRVKISFAISIWRMQSELALIEFKGTTKSIYVPLGYGR